MKNRLKGFAFMLTTVVSSLTAQNVVVNGPDGKLQVTVSCPEEGKASYLFITESRCSNLPRWGWKRIWVVLSKE